ncbi:hypothetical protein C8R46DRAFT_1094959 [Mycena filopes]|nr:hypothetical protein C8R46DRAFT_1094959 [Mycena filopes]
MKSSRASPAPNITAPDIEPKKSIPAHSSPATIPSAVDVDPQKVSTRFCFPDSDLTVASSDNVLFKVHHKNLSVNSDVLAGTRPENKDGEVVPLPETADVLELLFQYMYPQPQPDLTGLEFAVLAGLAEAAEKYSVYSARGWCSIKMKDSAAEHPLQVLEYAVKHGQPDLATEAAQHSIPISVAEALDVLTHDTFVKWILFQERYNKEKLNFFSVMTKYPDDVPLLAKCLTVPNPFRTCSKELEGSGYRERMGRLMAGMKFVVETSTHEHAKCE